MRILVITPHYEPDTAPTGLIMSSLVSQWAEQGHQIEVVTSLPWYERHKILEQWKGSILRKEKDKYVTVTRLHPFPQEKEKIFRRAVSFLIFSFLVLAVSIFKRGPFDAVIALAPPLTLGNVGKVLSVRHRCKLILNLQDIFPDVAIALGKVKSRFLIKSLQKYEKFTYSGSDALTVLSKDLEENVSNKISSMRIPPKVEVIPNFLISESIKPQSRYTKYREEYELGEKLVVMYAGNLGNSQSFELMIKAAENHEKREDVIYVINGSGVMSETLKEKATELRNLKVIDYQPIKRLSEVLATADIHIVPLRTGLGHMSVPSKIYSIFAAGRPVLASVDSETEIERIIRASGAGIAVQPDDFNSFRDRLEELIENSELREEMGNKARIWLEKWYSPEVIAGSYLDLVQQ